ncbi:MULTISPECIES: bifunctional 2-C-methyl-D-erythritol 4-phosphate cytidylyltransferase/2-C-methyl-D-erythritol 2,4-cyclodiphosphate synthase [unclassified Paracoccus (in: a-proteobacteria)]|uniref:bifunctional 2-C-methyl-D-erythritol 4-phosphate cytidylyltransferase/2-C-methyl-D-erythritol 2,4-cyclodiphosphate synthase n=1 Tax=unclassified Paracoccus (in: a-proteobacteria) TaxID=2688777 RepID=UPI0012B3A067|nr:MULTISPECIES: bifunctional 2-C-methyl-D-erythritol 4-phosphate cytidylyltransferase/2-C-methyl-D-erythritol 2,4-cyclodiphosphate synthase [unclassified Paracoccus (in: a-proteobacteria)]UXU74226.1 bifunctional 2-C-methyl-D-erythritol 4-phosphate cytidylyltransferase/2-C-methyl-D-erythritol 2,4-cyclodiphosphate synthase [Paracoccus sp. SMMA_5]UXU80117.1 bifunctional 2-C-methyl-D-erythritol 4-phosphate cytidylyltransferase/2-C-methyl-D-erythritol 2,4-cyclodiphosphate synthase [Paracoccus sp. SMM
MDIPATYAVIITAAGRGTRAGEGPPKQWRDLAGDSVLARSIRAFAGFGRVIVTLSPQDMARGAAELAGPVTLVAGGETRSDSVRRALETLEGSDITHVLIHDGARPLVSPRVIAGVVAALKDGAEAAAPALPVTDALWRAEGGRVTASASRDGLFRAQTPQGFALAPILAAHRAHPQGAADDVELALRTGMQVAVTPGDEDNLKITYGADFVRARRIVEGAMDIRLGNGFDVHAFTQGDHVWLCGLRIDHDRALLGHSDADVGMHALTDAIYGALAQGDIGRHFPPSDPQWKGAESHVFLRHAAELARQMGYGLSNADVTLICERPKIGPHAGAMAQRLAEIIGVTPDRISVKATTSERLGFTGREEGIAAIATATLMRA